jgi:hypothetical protein
MQQVGLSIHFQEDAELTTEEAKAQVVGVFNRELVDFSLAEAPRAYDVQDKQVDVLVNVDGEEAPREHAKQELSKVLADGKGAIAHNVRASR